MLIRRIIVGKRNKQTRTEKRETQELLTSILYTLLHLLLPL